MSRKRKSPRRTPSDVCCACLGTGEYQREHNAPCHWHLEKFSATHWSIIGRFKTLNDGESREEVMGVAEYDEAVRIMQNHNGEIDELLRVMRGWSWNKLLKDLKEFGQTLRKYGKPK